MSSLNKVTFRSNFSFFLLEDDAWEELKPRLDPAKYYVTKACEEDLDIETSVRVHNNTFSTLAAALNALIQEPEDEPAKPSLSDLLNQI